MKLNKNNKRIITAIVSSILNKKYIDNEVIDLYESEINESAMLTLEKDEHKISFTKLISTEGIVVKIQNSSYEKCIVVNGEENYEVVVLINEVFNHVKKFIDNTDVDNVKCIINEILN